MLCDRSYSQRRLIESILCHRCFRCLRWLCCRYIDGEWINIDECMYAYQQSFACIWKKCVFFIIFYGRYFPQRLYEVKWVKITTFNGYFELSCVQCNAYIYFTYYDLSRWLKRYERSPCNLDNLVKCIKKWKMCKKKYFNRMNWKQYYNSWIPTEQTNWFFYFENSPSFVPSPDLWPRKCTRWLHILNTSNMYDWWYFTAMRNVIKIVVYHTYQIE